MSILDELATQSAFAKIVGVSRQAILHQVNKGALEPGKTNQEWLVDYLARLRKEASGHGGDEKASLTASRTRESEASAQLKELQFFREIGKLVPVDEIETLMDMWAAAAKSEIINVFEKIIISIESEHGIKINHDGATEQIGFALSAIADYPKNFVENDDEDGENISEVA